MKAQEIASNNETQPSVNTPVTFAQVHRSARYQKALDGRKQPIRGLWIRNGQFVARLRVRDERTGKKANRWILLKDESGNPITLIGAARNVLRTLSEKRAEGSALPQGRTPKFCDFLTDYWAEAERKNKANRASGLINKVKRPATLSKEKSAFALWVNHLGETRLGDIRDQQIKDFIAKRQSEGIGNRTITLDMIALRNVLKLAVNRKYIKVLPAIDKEELGFITPKRDPFSAADIEKLCGKALEVSKNGQQFSDYIRLMIYCGARRDETLRLMWSDVKWDREQIEIGSDGLAKNGEPRCVDFNPQLEAHLKDMQARRAPDTAWLFPSPQRGDRDIRTKTFRETLSAARGAAGLPKFGFHDCRHFFISKCVMAGIDFMTIAAWVGHQDGGILIGKVYGHIADEHRRQMAQRLSFTPTLVDSGAAAARSA